MKKYILLSLSLLLTGNFCFAGNRQDFRNMILGNDKQEFTELNTTLKTAFKESNQVNEIKITDKMFLQEEALTPREMLIRDCPEYLNTTVGKRIMTFISQNPVERIKDVALGRYGKTLTVTAKLTSGKDTTFEIVVPDDSYKDSLNRESIYLRDINRIKEYESSSSLPIYRELIRLQLQMRNRIESDIKKDSGSNKFELLDLPFACKRTVAKVDSSGYPFQLQEIQDLRERFGLYDHIKYYTLDGKVLFAKRVEHKEENWSKTYYMTLSNGESCEGIDRFLKNLQFDGSGYSNYHILIYHLNYIY